MFFSHFRHFPGTQQLLPTTILLEFTQNNTGGRVQSWKSAFLGVERVQNFSSCQPTIRFQAARAQTRRLYWSNCDAESVPVSPLHLSHVRRLSDGERRWFQYESNESALAVSWDEARGTYVASRWSGPESNMAAVVFVVIALLALAHLDLPLLIVLFLSIILSCWCWTSIALKTTTTTTTFFDHDLNQYRISFSLFFYFLNNSRIKSSDLFDCFPDDDHHRSIYFNRISAICIFLGVCMHGWLSYLFVPGAYGLRYSTPELWQYFVADSSNKSAGTTTTVTLNSTVQYNFNCTCTAHQRNCIATLIGINRTMRRERMDGQEEVETERHLLTAGWVSQAPTPSAFMKYPLDDRQEIIKILVIV